MFKLIRAILVTVLFFGSALSAQAKNLNIIVTIKPLYSLVANVIGDQSSEKGDSLHLIVDGGLDPHIFRLKPSDIRTINKADMMFYIDPNMETFLRNILKGDNSDIKAVAMAQQQGIHLIPYRTSKIWGEHEEEAPQGDEHDADHHHEGSAQDLHIWLDPENARAMVLVIEKTLSDLNPERRSVYAKNAAITITKLSVLEAEIKAQLQPLRDKPMIVYHDAFQYYEKAFGLKSVGAIILRSDQTPSAKHIMALTDLAREKKVTCVLAAPGAQPRIASIIMKGTNAGFGVVDPLGLLQNAGPDLYFDMMRKIAQSLLSCQKD